MRMRNDPNDCRTDGGPSRPLDFVGMDVEINDKTMSISGITLDEGEAVIVDDSEVAWFSPGFAIDISLGHAGLGRFGADLDPGFRAGRGVVPVAHGRKACRVDRTTSAREQVERQPVR